MRPASDNLAVPSGTAISGGDGGDAGQADGGVDGNPVDDRRGAPVGPGQETKVESGCGCGVGGSAPAKLLLGFLRR